MYAHSSVVSPPNLRSSPGRGHEGITTTHARVQRRARTRKDDLSLAKGGGGTDANIFEDEPTNEGHE